MRLQTYDADHSNGGSAARRSDDAERAFCGTEVVLDDLSGGVALCLPSDCGGPPAATFG